MIKRLYDSFVAFVGKGEPSSEETKNEKSTQEFETPDMKEYLKKNQTADEL